jgi:ATP-dependent helicase HrpB
MLSLNTTLVLEAPPGTGKTTKVPWAIASAFEGQVLCLEPRRIAARTAATFVAAGLQELPGMRVGYAVRFEKKSGPDTRVLYMTEALLTKKLAEEPDLPGVCCVILDEFHERNLHSDIALAWIRKLQQSSRPDVRLVVMSASLGDAAQLAARLQCACLQVAAPGFPVEISYAPRKSEKPIELQVQAAIRVLLEREGDILVFLPGVGEIKRCQELLAGLECLVVPLYGELSVEEQDRALKKQSQRRVILATNVAETSVTVEGVRAVVDSGLARVAGYDPWTGMAGLELQPISRSSSLQRAGRAGREAPGLCLRLYTKADHDSRPESVLPELLRTELTGVVLELADAGPLYWLDAPESAVWEAATAFLERIGALREGKKTEIGKAMARLPLAPRLARVLVEAEGLARQAALLAVLLEQKPDRLMDRVEQVCSEDIRSLERWLSFRQRQEYQQLLKLLDLYKPAPKNPTLALTQALFAGFFDRVGRRKGSVMLLSGGGSAQLDPAAVGENGLYLITGIEKIGRAVRVFSATPFPLEWVLEEAEIRTEAFWTGERVEAREQWLYRGLVVEEGPGVLEPEAASRILLQEARPVLHRLISDWEEAMLLLRRLAWLKSLDFTVPELELESLLIEATAGLRSLEELKAVYLEQLIRSKLGDFPVDSLAPVRLQLKKWRAPVEYPEEGEPYISSRLQDFFGLTEGPIIANKHRLLLQLLAPNHRPVQLTRDLAGFWLRHYPALRKELMRKYPRHAWPEDPLDPASIAAAQPVPRRS